MEHGEIIDIPVEHSLERIALFSNPETTHDYFSRMATQVREYLRMWEITDLDDQINEIKTQMELMLRACNNSCPFIGRLVEVESAFHEIVATNEGGDSVCKPTAIEAGKFYGTFTGFELLSFDYNDIRINLGLVAKTAVEVDRGEYLFFYTPLDIGSCTPVIPELN
ncbi:hypothetical protein KBD20_04440 [Candidatus Saccharibacteria bacterium]|nr:hypothetical protein [Candidatus Saccharibacteria bacterium]